MNYEARKQQRAIKALKRRARGVRIPMPEQRTQEEIRSEYANVCAQAGEVQFKIIQFQGALADLNKKIEDLNKEFTTAKPAVAEEAPNAEEATVPPTA